MRNIYIINAQIVDSNGTHAFLDGYPKKVDSNGYAGDVDKARRRADGLFSEAWGAMCKNDMRLIQTVTLEDVYGNQLDRKSMGRFPDDPEPEPTPEPEATTEG